MHQIHLRATDFVQAYKLAVRHPVYMQVPRAMAAPVRLRAHPLNETATKPWKALLVEHRGTESMDPFDDH